MAEINILIIEDDQESAAALERTLKEVGYNVWTTENPKEGLEWFKDTNFALVISETRSARMNGIELTRNVHKISPDTNVIVLTFYSFIAQAIEAMEAGAYGYITKPLNTSEIRIVVERALERYFLLSVNVEKDYYAEMAVLDGLTGLYNRRYFNELMILEFSRLKRADDVFSLLMIDIDNFKTYNDTKGHPAGDKLLKEAAQVFQGVVREVDSVCRYGGEEFVVILSRTDKEETQVVAERLRAQVNLYLAATVSIGIACAPQDGKNSQELIEKADTALYEAKRTGKNKFCAAK
ncbi:MAG: Two-component response regulator [Parcubacteria group bacterium GW2011_GWA2_43_17]|nr:MAG: Two-component response regulator [Parcubacteria group bacterium GW2011_GWA2_43_17]KKT89948.1 MAG: Two-component response regulator [Parcubacteria group bacterium GW2011_GWF2_45_11]